MSLPILIARKCNTLAFVDQLVMENNFDNYLCFIYQLLQWKNQDRKVKLYTHIFLDVLSIPTAFAIHIVYSLFSPMKPHSP